MGGGHALEARCRIHEMLKPMVMAGLLLLGAIPGSMAVLRATPGAGGGEPPGVAGPDTRRQFLDTYCIACHNEKRKANFANLALDSIDVQQLSANAPKWEKVIKKLREAEVAMAEGSTVAQASRKIGVTEQTFYRWRAEYGGLRIDQARRLKQLETENGRLRRAVADLTLDNQILKEAAQGNF